ncbi:Ras-related protein RABG3a, partial [Zea mays]
SPLCSASAALRFRPPPPRKSRLLTQRHQRCPPLHPCSADLRHRHRPSSPRNHRPSPRASVAIRGITFLPHASRPSSAPSPSFPTRAPPPPCVPRPRPSLTRCPATSAAIASPTKCPRDVRPAANPSP